MEEETWRSANGSAMLQQIHYFTFTGQSLLFQNFQTGSISEYDEGNRMIQQFDVDGVVKNYTYDIGGNRTSMTVINSNGAVTTYTYNNANLITSLVNTAANGTVLSQFTYSYCLDGNQATKVQNGRTTTYTYDRLGRLLVESETGGETLTYTYDQHGNRLTLTATGTSSYTVAYTYDQLNRLRRTVKTEGGVTETTEIAYDNNGNQTRYQVNRGAGVVEDVQMSYNPFGWLETVNKNGALTYYACGPDGLRYTKTVNGATTKHIWDGQNMVAEVGASTNLYLRGVGLIGCVLNGVAQYYTFNAHGDVAERLNASGGLLHRYDYDAFGVERGMDASDANPFRYCGEYYDKELDLIYLRARYYKPKHGRFTQEDIAKSGLNWYTYCGNNPIAFIDPRGLSRSVSNSLIYDIITLGKEVGEKVTTLNDGSSYNRSLYNDEDYTRYRFHADILNTIEINEGSFSYELDDLVNIYSENREIYERLAEKSNVPAELIAALHYRESGGDFNTYLHNGDPLGYETVNVPQGIYFEDFEEAALDCLQLRTFDIDAYQITSESRDMVAMLALAESHIGHGDYQRGMASSFLYSGTTAYEKGKYVTDSIYDPNFVDRQPGVYIMLKALM